MSINRTRVRTQPNMQKKPRKDGKPFADNGSSLGNTTRFASASAMKPNNNNNQSIVKTAQNNTKKYKLQEIAGKLNPNGRMNRVCMKTMTDEFVDLHYNESKEHAHFRGLMRCDKYWECPVCSSRYTSRQAEDVRQAYSQAVDVHGWHVALVTYTTSHTRLDELANNIEVLRESRRSMRSGGWWQRFRRDFGYEGCISAMEVTYGFVSGWHVHVHELMFLSSDYVKEYQSDDEMRTLEDIMDKRLSKRWSAVVKRHGKTASIEHGIDVKLQDKYVAEYVAKEGHLPESVHWDTALELTKSMQKISKGGLHPFQILELSNDPCVPVEKRNQLKALWCEYVTAFDGRAMFYWTPELKKMLLIEEVVEGEEETKESDTVIHIPKSTWKAVLYARKQADLLNETIYVRGSPDKINRWLKKLCDDVRLQRSKDEYWRELNREKRKSIDYEANRHAEENAPKGTLSKKAQLRKELIANGYGKTDS